MQVDATQGVAQSQLVLYHYLLSGKEFGKCVQIHHTFCLWYVIDDPLILNNNVHVPMITVKYWHQSLHQLYDNLYSSNLLNFEGQTLRDAIIFVHV